MSVFAQRLKSCRENKKKENPQYTQGYVAEKIGVARTTYTAYENGTKIPPLDTVNLIADFFNVTTDYLLGRENFTARIRRYRKRYNDLLKIKSESQITDRELLELDKLSSFLKSDDTSIDVEEMDVLDFLMAQNSSEEVRDEKDIAKRLEQFKQEIENSDGLAFSGEPLSDEAKESLIESMEHIFRQTQRINKKYIPKKFRDDE